MSVTIVADSPEDLPAGKHIERDPCTGDYAAYYNRRLLGYRRTRPEAQTLADQYVYDLFQRGGAVTAGALAEVAE